MKKITAGLMLGFFSTAALSVTPDLIKLSSKLPDNDGDGKVKVVSMAKQLGVPSGTVLTYCFEKDSLFVYTKNICPSLRTATDYILEEFATVPVKKGNFTTRQFPETPVLVLNATGTKSKYAFDLRDSKAPSDKRAAFVNVTIKDLKSTDAFGAGIVTGAPGMELFFSNVTIEPNWPNWISYSKTNYDGITLDGTSAVYAHSLTIRNWNADGAIDNKSLISQFVNLKLEGKGHRGIRFWTAGPHYVVDSALNNSLGSIVWFKNCSTATLYVYNSKFNGAAEIPKNKIECDIGKSPKIVYLNYDPKTSGEMHEMFHGN